MDVKKNEVKLRVFERMIFESKVDKKVRLCNLRIKEQDIGNEINRQK